MTDPRDAYTEAYLAARDNPEQFWGEAARALHWDVPWERVLDDTKAPLFRWFTGGQLNTCHNAIDRHVANGRGAQAAVIYDSPVTNTIRTISYAELLDEVARFAGVLQSLGVQRGDRVVIYMPMTPETLIGMYACARIGAVHSVVFGGFAPHELAVRIDDAEPKVILTASCGIEVQRMVPYKPLLDDALRLATHQPAHVVVLQRDVHRCELTPGRDHDWAQVMRNAQPVPCVPVLATDPLYVLYTSGTTGQPKGVVRDHGGHAVALHWSMQHVYGMQPGEVFWAASDFGWAVGHSYIVYAPLLYGCTTVVHEGKPVGTPDAGEFWRVIEQHDVRVLFTAPTAFRAIKREDPQGTFFTRYDLSRFRALFLAGERLDPDTYHWARALLQKPVVDHWWQTETGWPVAANCLGLTAFPVKPGSPTKPVPGYTVQILDDDGHEVPPNKEGAVVIKLPLPPGTLPTLWRNDARFVETYLSRYPGYYLTGDGGYIDEDGYLFIMGRVDDIIIVAGHNLSTGSMEQALSGHPDVAECAVIGVKDALKTQLPVGLVVLKAGVQRDAASLQAELVQRVREQVGPVANFRQVAIVARLPKTRSGKVLRKTMRAIADGDAWSVPATIDDPTTLSEITTALQQLGLARAPIIQIGGE
ncbi:propionyl-CoA synthetase [Gemmatimonas phototrophica]|uniref:Propionyl-CoA synthetase n=1 Tax=Gemmatimonas phototrophica TaxID=1379270 RepID=A0A143BND8_9BACT|nr:propionyl-CoA synthetase [Gemmatimonas phototrophica]AMW05944.1 propionyl-CoA synthetase [Gemmatimonas phototrophica]